MRTSPGPATGVGISPSVRTSTAGPVCSYQTALIWGPLSEVREPLLLPRTRTSESGPQKEITSSSATYRFEVPDRTRSIHCRNFKSVALERAREGAAIQQDVLSGDEAGLGAAEEGAGIAELIGLAEAAGGVELGALGQDLVRRDAALVG